MLQDVAGEVVPSLREAAVRCSSAVDSTSLAVLRTSLGDQTVTGVTVADPTVTDRQDGGPTGAPSALADLLGELKTSSGRSYEALARRTGMSRSTVHRYCTGAVVPEVFGPIESIGRACRADQRRLDELYRAWQGARALVPAPPTPPTPAPAATEGPASMAPDGASLRSAPVRLTGRRVTALIAALTLASGSLLAVVTARRSEPPAPSQEVFGPAWTQPPRPVPREFFGVTINSPTGLMPTFPIGSVRLWDSDTRWSQIQPRRGVFDWTVLDRHVTAASAAGLPVVYTFGATPAWAATPGPRTPYEDGSRASAPRDLADWERFVDAVATRYEGRIGAYELWVSAPSVNFYSGSVEELVGMTRRAAAVLRRVDPAATIICPSMGDLWQESARAFLERFSLLGGYDDCDVAGVKLAPRNFSDPPESLLELTDLIRTSFHRGGRHLWIWSTGTSYAIAQATRLSERDARNYAVRLYLIGLYARYDRLYFYNWGGRNLPIVLQVAGGPPTEAAEYVAELQRWLAGAQIHACGHGRAIRMPDNVFECRFLVPGPDGGRQAAIVWTDRGTARVTVREGTEITDLSGRRRVATAGALVEVGEEPMLQVARDTQQIPSHG